MLQTVLARRIVAATWRLERAERLEAELFAENHLEGGGLGLALIRDCRRARSFDTLVRYRGGTLAEFWRALRTLKALQAEAAAPQAEAAPHAVGSADRRRSRAATWRPRRASAPRQRHDRTNPRAAEMLVISAGLVRGAVAGRGDPADPAGTYAVGRASASLLAGTALVPACPLPSLVE